MFWDPLSNRRQKLPSTGYIATIGNEPGQIPTSPKQISTCCYPPPPISHPDFPPEAENLPHKEVEIRAPHAMVVDRDPQTVLTVDGRVRNGSDAVLLQPQHDFDIETFQRGLIVA